MNYFQILGIVFGLIALLKPFYMHILPWDENKYISKAYKEKRPVWLVIVGIAGILLVAFTWYQHFALNIPYSIILTILFSLTAVKALMLIFDYKRFQSWVSGMLKKDKGRKIVVIDVLVGVFGAAVVAASIIFY